MVIRFPNTRKKLVTPTLNNAGSNPVWNFTGGMDYERETEIEFLVMEDDEYSKDDLIGSATIHCRHFTDGFDGELELQQPKKRGKEHLEEELGPGGYRLWPKKSGNKLLREVFSQFFGHRTQQANFWAVHFAS